MTNDEFVKELKHLETIASTIVGLGDPGASPARVAQEKIRTLIDWVESRVAEAADDVSSDSQAVKQQADEVSADVKAAEGDAAPPADADAKTDVKSTK